MTALNSMKDALLEQRMAALGTANTIRSGQSNVRKQIRQLSTSHGVEFVADMIEHANPHAGSMPIGRLLGTIRRVGHTKAAMWCSAADIRRMDRRVDSLSDRQKVLLATILRRYATTFRDRWEN